MGKEQPQSRCYSRRHIRKSFWYGAGFLWFLGTAILGTCFLNACGPMNDQESDVQRGRTLSATSWTNKPSTSFIAVDKFYFGSSSPASFFSCLKRSAVEQFIGGFNSGNTGGTYVGNHLARAKAAGLKVSAYFAFNSASNLSDSSITTFLNQIQGKGVERVWLDIEANAGGGGRISNFYKRVCESAKYPCGVYTNTGGMSKSGLSASDLRVFNKSPLWYADASGELNPHRNLGSFYVWSKSDGRQIYLDDNLCGTGVDVSIMDKSVVKLASTTTPSDPGEVDPVTPPTDPVTNPPDDPAEPDNPPTNPSMGKHTCRVGDEVTVSNLSGDATVNVRKGPGTTYEKLGTLDDGATAKIVALKSGGAITDPKLNNASSKSWFQIDFEGQTGYFNALYGTCY